MCIKILRDNNEFKYDAKKPLADQIINSQQIIVNYEPFDKDVDSFLKEVDNFAKTGVDAKLNIKVIHNDDIFGIKIKKKLSKATHDIKLNEIIKLMVLTHAEADKKLEELANICVGNCNVK